MKVFVPIAGLLLAIAPVRAGSTGADVAAQIAPWFDDQAIAVVHLNLARLDARAVASLFAQAEKAGFPKDDLGRIDKEVSHWLVEMEKAGTPSVFVVWTLSAPERPFFVVPLKKGAEGTATEHLARAFRHTKTEVRGSVLLAGDPAMLSRLEAGKRTVPELEQGFAAAGDAAMRAVVRVPATLRRALLETVPRLPAEVGGAAMSTLDRGVAWAALGVDLAPSVALRLVIQSHDAAAAKALAVTIDAAFAALRKDAKQAAMLPEVDKLLTLLTPKLEKDRLVVSLDDGTLAQVVTPLLAGLQARAARLQVLNTMKNLAIAMHCYHDVGKTFPAWASYDAKGRPLLSWRVHVLPYVEEQPLYQQFKLDEPWDSPHNKKLIPLMPVVFRVPGQKNAAGGKTCFQVPLAKDGIFDGTAKGVTFKDITDGTSNTLMLVETDDDHAVIWTKPADWQFDVKTPFKGLGRPGAAGFNVAFADGSARLLPRTLKAETMRLLILRNDGQPLPAEVLDE